MKKFLSSLPFIRGSKKKSTIALTESPTTITAAPEESISAEKVVAEQAARQRAKEILTINQQILDIRTAAFNVRKIIFDAKEKILAVQKTIAAINASTDMTERETLSLEDASIAIIREAEEAYNTAEEASAHAKEAVIAARNALICARTTPMATEQELELAKQSALLAEKEKSLATHDLKIVEQELKISDQESKIIAYKENYPEDTNNQIYYPDIYQENPIENHEKDRSSLFFDNPLNENGRRSSFRSTFTRSTALTRSTAASSILSPIETKIIPSSEALPRNLSETASLAESTTSSPTNSRKTSISETNSEAKNDFAYRRVEEEIINNDNAYESLLKLVKYFLEKSKEANTTWVFQTTVADTLKAVNLDKEIFNKLMPVFKEIIDFLESKDKNQSEKFYVNLDKITASFAGLDGLLTSESTKLPALAEPFKKTMIKKINTLNNTIMIIQQQSETAHHKSHLH